MKYVMAMRTNLALKYPGKLRTEGMPFNTVQLQYGGVSREARPDAGDRAVIDPIDQPGQRGPIRFLVQRLRNRLGAGDDDTIGRVGMEVAELLVVTSNMSSRRI